MHPVTVTLNFPSLHEAQVALAAIDAAACVIPDPRQETIDFEDRPDVGAAPVVKPFPDFSAAFNPFAKAAVVQVPPPVAAPSTAVAAAAPTVPAAPSATSTAPVSVPPPPAPPTAPAAPALAVPAAPSSPAGIEVDHDGLPWDARIHAGGRAKNADGRWRQKRGLNDGALKARVEAELRQAMGAPAAASVPVPLPPAVAPTPPTSPPSVASATVTAAPTITTTTPTAPPPPTEPAADTFPALAARLGPHLVSGKLTQEQLGATLAVFGLSSMSQLAVRPDLVASVGAQLDALVAT
jgi:hypothetical protein